MKKIFIIFSLIILVGILGFFGWYLFMAEDAQVPAEETPSGDLPFGSGGSDIPLNPSEGGSGTTNPDGTPSTGFEEPVSRTENLFKISETPVAGFVLIARGTSTLVRYLDRGTGHIYEVSFSGSSENISVERRKITNNTLPKIYEAYFRPDGNAVVIRSLKDDTDVIENISLAIGALQSTSTEATYNVSATPLRGDMGSIAVGAGNTLFYTLEDASSLNSSAFNGTGLRTLFTSAFKGWRLDSSGNSLIAYSSASMSAPGYAYAVNTTNGALTNLIGPLNGLIALTNGARSRIAYSYADGLRTRLLAVNGQGEVISEMSPSTLAEKCVWSARNTDSLICGAPNGGVGAGEPDNWYLGKSRFSDDVWLFDTELQTAKVLAQPKQNFNIDIDVSSPELSPSEEYLVFINRNDLSLWALKIEE